MITWDQFRVSERHALHVVVTHVKLTFCYCGGYISVWFGIWDTIDLLKYFVFKKWQAKFIVCAIITQSLSQLTVFLTIKRENILLLRG